jgi:hypothetical protein
MSNKTPQQNACKHDFDDATWICRRCHWQAPRLTWDERMDKYRRNPTRPAPFDLPRVPSRLLKK